MLDDHLWTVCRNQLSALALKREVIELPLFEEFNVKLSVLRADQLCLMTEEGAVVEGVNGNKLFKLLPNLLSAQVLNKAVLVTFGGGWSNHLHAVALAAKALGVRAVGIVRGERPQQLSATLNDCRKAGMSLYFVPRQHYRHLQQASAASLATLLGCKKEQLCCVPVGGTNTDGIRGAAMLGNLVRESVVREGLSSVNLWLPCATGGTLLGLANGIADSGQSQLSGDVRLDFRLTGVQVLSHSGLSEELSEYQLQLMREGVQVQRIDSLNERVSIIDGSCGGYARLTDAYRNFYMALESQLPFAIDHVYMGKLFYALWQSLKQNAVCRDQEIVLLHTGGQQGRRGLMPLPHTDQNNCLQHETVPLQV